MKKHIYILVTIFSLSFIDFSNASFYLGAGLNYITLADDDWAPEWGYQFVLGRQWPTFWSRFNFYGEIFVERNQGTLKNKLRELSDLDLIADNDIIVHEYAFIDYGIERTNYGCVLGIKAYLPGERLYIEAGVSLLVERMNYKYQKIKKYFTAKPEEMSGKVDYEAKDYLSEGGNRGRQFNGKYVVGIGFEVLNNRLIARVRYNHLLGEVVTSPSYDASSRSQGITVDVLLSL
ncbi:MAG TPA: hypothetical protein ENN17_10760 [bacterium]|nr:hypothetical protein [bacterium]